MANLFKTCTAVFSGLLLAGAVAAQTYPSKPVTLMVPYPAGGLSDVIARTVNNTLSKNFGQPVIVENRAGASSNIASEFVARSSPDGYTLLLGTIANATNMTAYKNMGYDTLRDFVHITQFMTAPSVLTTHPAVPAKNLKELIAVAKQNPGKLAFSSSGNGGSPHLAGEMLKMRANIDLIHVPYKGAAPAIADLLGGQVQMSFQTALSAIPHLKSGKLNVIAVASKKRMGTLPNVPTMAEAGLPDFEVSSWNGLFAPAKTPPHIVAALYSAASKALKTQDIIEKMEAQGAEPVGNSPEEFARFVDSEIVRWRTVVQYAGAKPE